MYTQTASHDDHHTPTGWKRWAYSTTKILEQCI
jgi:cytochrome c oxidase subunit I